jgi:hypothetical protein
MGFNRSSIIAPDCMDLLMFHTMYISRKLNSAVASTRYIMVSENVMPFTISEPDDAYMDFQR